MVLYNPLTETRDFQRVIVEYLVETNGYVERSSKTDYDPVYAMDIDLLLGFLDRTQPESMGKLRDAYNGDWKTTVVNRINNAIGKKGLVRCLWDGVPFDGDVTLDLVYPRPSAHFDAKAMALYDDNVLSVMEEVYHKEGERIDLVIFLNGLAIFTAELKCNSTNSGWNYRNAIKQYQEERDCRTRLLKPRVGALAHFALDLNEVYVCAELKGRESVFLPFNQGQSEGDDPHATRGGNPHNPNGVNTSYLWEDVWKKDTVFDLIYDFVFIATKRDKRNKKIGEVQIFPRFQQLRAVRRVIADMQQNGTRRNYLIEHSAGSGKTNTIAWMAHRLAKLYTPGSDDPLFDKVIIVTDRRVVDRQLQAAVIDMAKSPGVVRVMDENKTANDLGKALSKSYRIVVTTIQKFLHLHFGAFEGAGKNFAVLIDEAHGSTSGKSMAAVNATLAGGIDDDSSLDELARFIQHDISQSAKQANISMVGFTATPTGKALQQFGVVGQNGAYEAFDLYSMRQAIDEGFILDVTANYTTYDAFCRVVKTIEDDPELESRAAKRKLAHMISTADGTIRGNLSVMVEHFMETIAPELGGQGKAMIVTAGREEAVRYFLAFERLRRSDSPRYGTVRALVAFTGSVDVDGETYTEAGLNGFPEDKTPDYFDTQDYRILIVADKYQTGFDQPKLCGMYVDKKLRGITAVQTLSRLNRICPPYDKRTFVLDFRNSFDDITGSFAPYYATTVLEDPLTLSDVRETERRLTELQILDDDDVEEFNALLAKPSRTSKDKNRMWALLDVSARLVGAMDEDEADEARRIIRNFIKQYAFLLQVMRFEDRRLHMEYNFCISLIREIDSGHGGGNDFDIADKVRLEGFGVEKTGEHRNEKLESEPEVFIAKGTGTGLTVDQFERLSKIIEDWNARFGVHFDAGVAAGSLVSLKNALEADPRVQQSAHANSKRDFVNTLQDRTDDALVKGYEQNEEWFGFLLNNDEARRQLIHAFVDDVYNSLRDQD